MYSISTGYVIYSQCLLSTTVLLKHIHIHSFLAFNLSVYGSCSQSLTLCSFPFHNKSEWFVCFHLFLETLRITINLHICTALCVFYLQNNDLHEFIHGCKTFLLRTWSSQIPNALKSCNAGRAGEPWDFTGRALTKSLHANSKSLRWH